MWVEWVGAHAWAGVALLNAQNRGCTIYELKGGGVASHPGRWCLPLQGLTKEKLQEVIDEIRGGKTCVRWKLLPGLGV